LAAAKPVRLLEEAQEELDQATGWYTQREQEVGQRFWRAVDDALLHLEDSPSSGSRLLGLPSDIQVRRLRLRPYEVSDTFLGHLPGYVLAFAMRSSSTATAAFSMRPSATPIVSA
jgi:plasmid stabilization system protein ParE